VTRGWFVTGTDTGVGKTFVTAALARELSGAGYRVAAIKPAESGCPRVDQDGVEGVLRADDAETIASAAGGWQAPEERCLYKFEEAVAPGVAAERVGVDIDLLAIQTLVQRVAAKADLALVEGAGGWLVPLGGGKTIADLAWVLRLPVVIVARGGLGTINHSLLTVDAVARRGLEVTGVVLSARPDEGLDAVRSNRDEIVRHWGAGGVGRVWIRCGDTWVDESPIPLFHVER
jgi:dethiobiotin synthetase